MSGCFDFPSEFLPKPNELKDLPLTSENNDEE